MFRIEYCTKSLGVIDYRTASTFDEAVEIIDWYKTEHYRAEGQDAAENRLFLTNNDADLVAEVKLPDQKRRWTDYEIAMGHDN